jgi:hypothetical protein
VHAHQRHGGGARLALDQRQMHLAVDVILVADQPEAAELGDHLPLGDAFNRVFGLQPVADQVGDRADHQAVLVREALEVGTARHRAVLVQDLDDHGRGLEAGEACKIAAGLGVAGAGQHASGLRHQREYVAGLAQVVRTGLGRDRGPDRVRAVEGGDAGRHTLGGLDGQREIGALVEIGVADHQRQAQLAAALAGQRQADQAAAIAGHEVHVGRAHQAGGHDQVAFVLPVLVVHDHDHASGAQVGEDFLDGVERAHARAIRPGTRPQSVVGGMAAPAAAGKCIRPRPAPARPGAA